MNKLGNWYRKGAEWPTG